MDEDANTQRPSKENTVVEVSHYASRNKIFAVRADEEMVIALDTYALKQDQDAVSQPQGIPIAISARHLHLTQEAVEILFGEGASVDSESADFTAGTVCLQ